MKTEKRGKLRVFLVPMAGWKVVAEKGGLMGVGGSEGKIGVRFSNWNSRGAK